MIHYTVTLDDKPSARERVLDAAGQLARTVRQTTTRLRRWAHLA